MTKPCPRTRENRADAYERKGRHIRALEEYMAAMRQVTDVVVVRRIGRKINRLLRECGR